MARNRVIKPSFWSDDKVGKLKRDVRLLFIGLLNFADDIGVVYGDSKTLRAKIFPYDDLTARQVEDWMRSLAEVGIVVPFQYQNNLFYAITNFSKHQTINRPNIKDTNVPKELLSELIEQHNAIPKRNEPRRPKKADKPPVLEDESFIKFKSWCSEHAPNVLKMAQPITDVQLRKLKEDFGVDMVCAYLEAMNNWKPLLTKCTNANKTLRNWIKRDEQNRITQPGTRTDGVRRGSAGVSDDYKRNILERLVGAQCTEDV